MCLAAVDSPGWKDGGTWGAAPWLLAGRGALCAPFGLLSDARPSPGTVRADSPLPGCGRGEQQNGRVW